MKKILGRWLLPVLCLAWGPAPAAGAGLKIGFVDTARVLKEAPQAEAARKRLERDFAPREKKILEMQKKLREMEDKLAQSGAFMSDAQRQKQHRRIKSQQREIKRAKEEFNEDLNLRRNEELHKLQKLIYEAIVALAREEKFDAILGETIYASKRVDVTDRVLQRLRQDFRKQGTKADGGSR